MLRHLIIAILPLRPSRKYVDIYYNLLKYHIIGVFADSVY